MIMAWVPSLTGIQSSMYLMAEECHPMCFELELENPELLPVD